MKYAAPAAIAALALAGCGTSAPAPHATVTVTAHAAASGSAAPSQASSEAHANARLIVSALASGTSASMLSARKLVAGTVMTHYISLQAIQTEAAEASGQPQPAESVTATGGGRYQLCYPQGGGCQSFSAFRADATGRITGMDVDGQPVAARLATGPSDSGNGLALTDVTSYQVGIAFRVRNTGNNGVSTLGFQPVFVTSPGDARLSLDYSASTIPGALKTGESATVVAVFDTRTFTGTLTLQSNGGYQALVSSRLTKPAG